MMQGFVRLRLVDGRELVLANDVKFHLIESDTRLLDGEESGDGCVIVVHGREYLTKHLAEEIVLMLRGSEKPRRDGFG